jgi:hypothetical protein
MDQIKRSVYIDGTNLYHGMSRLVDAGEYIDIGSLRSVICAQFGEINEFNVYGTYAHEDEVMRPEVLLFRKAQNEFFKSVVQIDDMYFGEGRVANNGQEKRVDLMMALDMALDAYKARYDEAIIITGDSDFLEPIERVREIGKKIYYCGIANRVSIELAVKSSGGIVFDYGHHYAQMVRPRSRTSPYSLPVVDIDNLIKFRRVLDTANREI